MHSSEPFDESSIFAIDGHIDPSVLYQMFAEGPPEDAIKVLGPLKKDVT